MITVIHVRDSPFVGGPEKQILGQCARLDRSRFNSLIVSFTCGSPNALLQAAGDIGIHAASLSDGKLAFTAAARQLRELIRLNGECVVITSGFKADFVAALACAADRVPWIAWFHGNTAATSRVRAYEALDMLVLRGARTVVAVCDHASQKLRRMGLPKVVVVPNAVDVDYAASYGNRESARFKLGISDAELVIGTAARLSVEKGLCHFIDAVPSIILSHPKARFVIVGDGPLRLDLESRASRLGVADRFIFTGFRDDVVALMKAMDVFVLPSLRENLPIALLEAMASGVSVVATDVGGVGEVLGAIGIEPIPPGSSRAIADAVIALLKTPQLAGERATTVVNRARQYSFTRQVSLMEQLIEEVLVKKI